MAHVEGSDLRDLLRREGRLEPERALDLIGQVASALDAAHEAGLVHRDVKPGNILVTRDQDGEKAYVCDFGLARHVSSVSSLTSERGFVGTIDYVPPEQIQGGQIDGRADVYSLGCVLFECLAGARPFDSESELSVLFAHLNEPVPPITDLRPELPPALDAVFTTALAKSADDRYSTCAELVRATRAALQGKKLPRRRRRDSRIVILAAGVVTAVAALGIGLFLSVDRGSSSRPPSILTVKPDSIALVDARTRRASKTFSFDSAPLDVAFGQRSKWVLLGDQQLVERVDTASGRITGRVKLPFRPGRITAREESAWVNEDSGPRVARVVARPDGKLALKRLLSVATRGDHVSTPGGIVVGAGSLWLARGPQVARVDPSTGRVLHRFPTPVTSNWIAFHSGSIWAASSDSGHVVKIDPVTNRITSRAHLHGWITDLAVGDGFVWVPVVPANVVYKLSTDDLSVQGQLASGSDPESVTLGAGALWIANTRGRSLTRIDLGDESRRVVRMSSAPLSVRYHHGRVWTAVAASPDPLPPLTSGQEIRIPLSRDNIGTLDPAAPANADRYQRDYATCANLLNYPDSDGSSGQQLRPEIAAAMPSVSADGRTYTFRIRAGFRFSPPSGEPVTAQTFRKSSPAAADLGRRLGRTGGDALPSRAAWLARRRAPSCNAKTPAACSVSRTLGGAVMRPSTAAAAAATPSIQPA